MSGWGDEEWGGGAGQVGEAQRGARAWGQLRVIGASSSHTTTVVTVCPPAPRQSSQTPCHQHARGEHQRPRRRGASAPCFGQASHGAVPAAGDGGADEAHLCLLEPFDPVSLHCPDPKALGGELRPPGTPPFLSPDPASLTQGQWHRWLVSPRLRSCLPQREPRQLPVQPHDELRRAHGRVQAGGWTHQG